MREWFIPVAVCCLWPLLVHFGIGWIMPRLARIDWQAMRLPWRKQ